MFHKILIAAIALLPLTACIGQTKKIKENNSLPDKAKLTLQIDTLVKEYQELDIFSGVVLVAEKGVPIYHKAFGLANREKNIPNTLNTKFDIGSMNKTFTKIVVLQLASEGKIQLSDNLGKFLEGFSPEAATKITIQHLLTHQSGLGDYHDPDFFESPKSEKTIAGLLPRIQKMPLHFPPGTEEEYSNAGYILLGAIVEKVSGKTYHQNVRERIVEPLGLKETYLENKDQVPDRSIGYFKDPKGNIHNNEGFLELPNPDGGFQATSLDILKFYRAYFYENKLLNAKAQRMDDAYERYQESRKTGAINAMAGGFNGANTVIFERLSDQLSVLVFANMNEPVAEQLGAGILAIIKGKLPAKPTLPASQMVYAAYKENGLEYVKTHFEELTTNFPAQDPRDFILNELAYDLMFGEDLEAAIVFFTLNTELFPEVANVWDSLGEAWLEKGDEKKALLYYKKALEVDPDLPTARQALERLEHR